MTNTNGRLCLLALTLFFSVSACGFASSSAGGVSLTNVSNSPLPFAAFLQQVKNAQYSDYARLSTTRVQNEQAFLEMRSYILKKYTGAQVASAVMNTDGQIFDCMLSTPGSGAATVPTPAQAPTSIPESSTATPTLTSVPR